MERALPGEGFTADDLLSILWEDPGIVVGVDDEGFAAATVRRFGELVTGFVKVVAVAPTSRQHGLGAALLDTVEQWCVEQGAREVHLSGTAPVYLWPGVDLVAMTPMLCLAERAGYEPRSAELNMVLPATYRPVRSKGGIPGGAISVRHVLDGPDLVATRAFVADGFAHWLDEFDRAVESGTAIGAFGDDGTPLGFVCHSVSRLGLLGPMATDPDRRGGGVGAALVGAVGTDLQAAGVPEIEICWVGPVTFYAKLGATVHRVFRTYRKRFR